jgi:hypothetical protein
MSGYRLKKISFMDVVCQSTPNISRTNKYRTLVSQNYLIKYKAFMAELLAYAMDKHFIWEDLVSSGH